MMEMREEVEVRGGNMGKRNILLSSFIHYILKKKNSVARVVTNGSDMRL